MQFLLIIMFVTLALAVRAGALSRRVELAGDETADDGGLAETCARTSLLVLVCLIGLLALGLMYGNVLGAGSANL